MSLQGKNLQIIDTMDLLVVDKTTGSTMFSGITNKAGISQTTTAIDIWAGIGQNKISSLRGRKEMMVKGAISSFDLDFFASMNGVNIDKNSKGTIYFNKVISVDETSVATIAGATHVHTAKLPNGTFLKKVDVTPTNQNEFKFDKATSKIHFDSSITSVDVLVTYEAPATTGKDNWTIVFNGHSFPKNTEVFLKTVAYDSDTEAICADVAVHFYKCSINPDFDFSFEMGNPIETPIELSVLVPSYIDDKENLSAEIGKLIVTER